MAYRKGYRPRNVRRTRTKYSVEQTSFSGAVTTQSQTNIVIVPPTGLQGMRKVKHLTISISTRIPQGSAGSSVSNVPFYYALVYVPQGTAPNDLNTTQTFGDQTGAASTDFQVANLYNPNQFVMSCGYIDPDAGPIRIRSPLARNLNSGDYIALALQFPTLPSSVQVAGLVQYAIALN